MAAEKAAEDFLPVSGAADDFREELDKQKKAIKQASSQAVRSAEQNSQCAKRLQKFEIVIPKNMQKPARTGRRMFSLWNLPC